MDQFSTSTFSIRAWLFLLVTLLTVGIATAQNYQPIPVTGFNEDVIANGNSDAVATTTRPMDVAAGTGNNVFYEKGYSFCPSLLYGLPSNQQLISVSTGIRYDLASYSSNNTLFLLNGGGTGSLTLSSPLKFDRLSFLATSAEAASTIQVVINFADATTSTYTIYIPDWFDTGASNVALAGAGRTKRDNTCNNSLSTSTAPRIYEYDLALALADRAKTIQSLSFTNNGGTVGRALIFALSGGLDSNPIITAGTAIGSATACVGTASTNQSFIASASDLGANLVVQAPTDFEVSTSSGTGFAASLNLTPTGGTVSSTTIYVRVTSAATVGSKGGNVTLSSTGANTPTVAVAGTVAPLATVNISASSSVVCEATTISVTGTASAQPVTYQWYKDGVSLGSNFQNAVLTLTMVQPSQSGQYTLMVTGICNTATSSPFNLTVNPLTTVGITPTSRVVCEGEAVSVTGTASTASTQSVTYQWYKDGSSLGSSQQNRILTLAAVLPTQSGNYSLVATGLCNSATSSAFSLSVNPLPTVTLIFGGATQSLVGPNLPLITLVRPLDPQNLPVFQVLGGMFYERLQVIDRINGYEIRRNDFNAMGIFTIDRLTPYTITVTAATGCKRTVYGLIQSAGN